jgi:hypothetical protein
MQEFAIADHGNVIQQGHNTQKKKKSPNYRELRISEVSL